MLHARCKRARSESLAHKILAMLFSPLNPKFILHSVQHSQHCFRRRLRIQPGVPVPLGDENTHTIVNVRDRRRRSCSQHREAAHHFPCALVSPRIPQPRKRGGRALGWIRTKPLCPSGFPDSYQPVKGSGSTGRGARAHDRPASCRPSHYAR